MNLLKTDNVLNASIRGTDTTYYNDNNDKHCAWDRKQYQTLNQKRQTVAIVGLECHACKIHILKDKRNPMMKQHETTQTRIHNLNNPDKPNEDTNKCRERNNKMNETMKTKMK